MSITPVSELVGAARARITQTLSSDAIALLDRPDVVFVDLRDVRERRAGFVPDSFHCPRGMAEFWVDPASPYHKDIFARPDTRFVFYCASGWRSALTVAALQDMGFQAEHLTDGFAGWTAAGGPVDHPAPRD